MSLSLAVTRAGSSWETHRAFIGPFPVTGTEVQLYSFAVDSAGIIYVAMLTNATTVAVYKSTDQGRSFQKLADVIGAATTVAPRLYVRGAGGLMLFTAQGSQTSSGTSSLSIFYTTSPDGGTWAPFKPLVTDPALGLNFSPDYLFFQGREYVVFQVLRTGAPAVYELYLSWTTDGGATWTAPTLLTGFKDPVAPPQANQALFSNERPFMIGVGDHISLVWERSYQTGPPQIYYVQLKPDGSEASDPERVTSGASVSRDPRVVLYHNQEMVFWFDNSTGQDNIYMATFNGVFWQSTDLSRMPGSSIFGRPVENGNSIYVLWYNDLASTSRLVFLQQDRSVLAPTMFGINFASGSRDRQNVYTFGWNAPPDPSGIAGFGYSIDQNPNGQAPHTLMALPNDRSAQFTVTTDGQWYVHLSASDYAGNWSPTTTVSFYRDTTPPGRIEFVAPELDAKGFLPSNTETIRWKPPADSDLAGYSYSFDYLAPAGATEVLASYHLRTPPDRVLSARPDFSFVNEDNGLWALTVSAVDSVGNIGDPTTIYLRLDKYVPVTYITDVQSAKNALGQITLKIYGRGFTEGGTIEEVILDRDGKPPYDYRFSAASGQFKVISDRIIDGPTLQDVQQGVYRVGLLHPTRGLYFTQPLLTLEPTGTVKFGEFAVRPEQLWQPMTLPSILFSANSVIILLILCFLAFMMVFSVARIAKVVQETRELRLEIHSLVTGTRITLPERRERLAAMKRIGLSLRAKFVMLITLLVIVVVSIVSVPLGYFMITTQQLNLANGLKNNAQVLMDSLTTGAKTYLPDQNILELGALPDQRVAMQEAQFVTITGYGANDTKNYNYVWASDDPNIQSLIGGGSVNPGVSRITDSVSPFVPVLKDTIDKEASAQVGALSQQLQKLGAEAAVLATKTDPQSARLLSQYQDEINVLNKQVTSRLFTIANVFGSVPAYDPEHLSRTKTEYTFYKPIVYRSNQDNVYFRGIVRVGVSTKNILAQMASSQRTLFITVAIVALAAIGLGLLGALILAAITINPIKRLVRGVEVIRDTDDKEQLKNHVIRVKTRDELSLLAETVNQMTQGLVAAAAANKDLTLGKDTQKMFTPLEQDPVTSRKLTTAHEENEYAELFGYYEGAKGVSGDYFDFRRLDDKHYAIIECDVAGKGVPASLIMVEVATIFADYVRNWSLKTTGIHLERLVYRINDLLEERGFKGRFAALLVAILNAESGSIYFCNAGYKYVHIYSQSAGKMIEKTLPEAPAAGVFPSSLVELQSGFQQVPHRLDSGDCLVLFTDGVEEAKRHFRDDSLHPLVCQEPGLKEGEVHGTHPVGADNEEFGLPRIDAIVNAVFARSRYSLEKYHTSIRQELTFDFTSCSRTIEEAVLAMVSIERVFRFYPDPDAGPDNRIMIDRKVVDFLRHHFDQFDVWFRDPIDHPSLQEYVYFTHLREDEQYDDLTILGIQKR
ncbi:MAG TPA: SpoIIE family protein phosphatase [Spirochaetia bacterium]|nr:SpoIIE family protein phosphatase [Spirochaetia bacterium]